MRRPIKCFDFLRRSSGQRRFSKSSVVPQGSLRWVMRQVPSPVVIVSAQTKGLSRGATCSSFTAVSLDPPIVSLCLRRPSATGDLLRESGRFAIHLLSDNMLNQSIAFSSPKTQSNFSTFPFFVHPSGSLPILKGCLAVLICSTERQLTMGDHDVFYGLVEQVLSDDAPAQEQHSTKKPLLYYQSTYRSIGDQLFIEAFESGVLESWTHVEHLRMAWTYLRDSGTPDLALPLIRNGIQNFNQVNAYKLKSGTEYNETMTRFFTALIHLSFQESTLKTLDFETFLSETKPILGDWKIIYQFYSKEELEKGRREFKEPDLRPFPTHWNALKSL